MATTNQYLLGNSRIFLPWLFSRPHKTKQGRNAALPEKAIKSGYGKVTAVFYKIIARGYLRVSPQVGSHPNQPLAFECQVFFKK
jgi:hypothetical protein